MGTASKWQPKWWTQEEHGTAWDRMKEAMKRDWEQTKKDVHAGGRELDQDVNDTVKQAAGKDVIPDRNAPNAPGGTSAKGGSDKKWDDVETPLRYGVGARKQYGAEHDQWNDKLEGKLKGEWESAKDETGEKWNDVKDVVRHGYDRARS